MLTIHDSEKVVYKADFVQPVEGKLGHDELTRMMVEKLSDWVENQETLFKQEELKLLGLHLYKILFGDERVRNAFEQTYKDFDAKYKEAIDKQKKANPDMRLRMRLIFTGQAKELARLPWEFLFVPIKDIEQGFFFTGERTNLILTRFVPALDDFKNLKPEDQPLRILIVFSQPDDLKTISEDETKEVIDTIKELASPGRVEVRQLNDPTAKELQIAMEDVVAGRPHILHFIGHGETGRIALIKDPNDQDYDTKKKGKQPSWVESKNIKAFFKNHKPRLVFLHACKGAAQGSLSSFKSMALDLVYADIPAVVAMQYKISNADAKIFTKTFYEQIGAGKEIDEAVKAGRVELGSSPPQFWENRRFGTPVVYLQSKEAIVLATAADDKVGFSEQVKCKYYDECRRMVYPDQSICGCPLNRSLKSAPASAGTEGVRGASPVAGSGGSTGTGTGSGSGGSSGTGFEG
jgi:hypothetical protein